MDEMIDADKEIEKIHNAAMVACTTTRMIERTTNLLNKLKTVGSDIGKISDVTKLLLQKYKQDGTMH